MQNPISHNLTKSRYMAGVQCPRRLWLLVHEPSPYEELEPGSFVELGIEVGLKARLLFPGGVAVTEEPWQHAEAVAGTAALMANETVPAIFEAAFEYDGIRIRVDVLERLALGSWGLREVKSSAGPKDHYLDEIAVQTHVLNGAGVMLSSIELIHINNSYVRAANGINWPELFTRVDVSDTVAPMLPGVGDNLCSMRESLRLASQPDVEPGSQCDSPYHCEFWDRCTEHKPKDWVHYLPRRTQAQATEMAARGIDAISAIPPDFGLSGRQTIIRDAWVSGRPFVAPDLARLLHGYGPPACYLDFESMSPPFPLYEGTRPYEALVFQWSLHSIQADGELAHREFLADHDRDPRRAFAETLIEALGQCDLPIVVYSPYEKTRLGELAAAFPDMRDGLRLIIGRLVDLLPIVRGAIYIPEAGFSNSIKAIGPALCPDFSYDDLEDIADGAAASGAFLSLATGDPAALEQTERLRSALSAYCQRDTLAMVEVHRALMRLANQTGA
jgi:hypothetical protein